MNYGPIHIKTHDKSGKLGKSRVSMKVAGGCVGMGDIRKYYFSHVLVHYMEMVNSIKTLSSLYSSLASSLSLINSISKPTTENLLFTPRRFCISSAILQTFFYSLSSGSILLATHSFLSRMHRA